MTRIKLKAPFPYFGGKGAVAGEIWKRFGDVARYIEPFCGSAAVLLARPSTHTGRSEIINDINGFIVNAYRAIAADPEAVWRHADYPISELDLKARHAYVQQQRETLYDALKADMEYYDEKLAGIWIWGASAAIGNDWLRNNMPSMPNVAKFTGIHADNGGYFLLKRLSKRLRKVVITNGDWKRVVTDMSVTYTSPTAVLLDPPYLSHDHESRLYGSHDDEMLARDSYAWAIEAAQRFPDLRIAYCSYIGHFECPDGWSEYQWTTRGGYANHAKAGRGRENREREVIWFSPACLRPEQQLSLFDEGE